MKVILQEDKYFIIRFDKGEDVIQNLQDWTNNNGISAGSFTGIGAAQTILLSFYNLQSKTYIDKQIITPCEITSLQGNITKSANETIIHAHGTFSKEDFSTTGGHIKKLIVSATCEIIVTTFAEKIERNHNDTIGLKLLI